MIIPQTASTGERSPTLVKIDLSWINGHAADAQLYGKPQLELIYLVLTIAIYHALI
jgi:hypothetical protein